jgi:hypothetical protein
LIQEITETSIDWVKENGVLVPSGRSLDLGKLLPARHGKFTEALGPQKAPEATQKAPETEWKYIGIAFDVPFDVGTYSLALERLTALCTLWKHISFLGNSFCKLESSFSLADEPWVVRHTRAFNPVASQFVERYDCLVRFK